MIKALEILEDISREEIVVRDRSSIYMNPQDNNKGTFTHLTTIGVNFKGALETIKQALQKAQEQEKEIAKYKKLEEEIGCPLDILLKGIINGIWYEDELFGFSNNHANLLNISWLKPSDKKDGLYFVFYDLDFSSEKTIYLYVKDYKKTWWLKEDKSE